MSRPCRLPWVVMVLLAISSSSERPAFASDAKHDRRAHESFLVIDHGYALLGPDGLEKERLRSGASGAGALSPDGRWVAFNNTEANPPPAERRGQLVIQSRLHAEERMIVRLVWGTTGSSLQLFWSRDSERILICEQGANEDHSRGRADAIYDLGSQRLTNLNRPAEWWPSDWSSDGRRLLTSLPTGTGGFRLAWVPIDGVGQPEFLTSDREVVYGARWSPDNRRILCMIESKYEDIRNRRCVLDLATKKRIVIDKPGHTHGNCWSSDGSRVAYTWQLPPQPISETRERKTYLITCDPDGSNQKTIMRRKYEVPPNSSNPDGVIIFFEVLVLL